MDYLVMPFPDLPDLPNFPDFPKLSVRWAPIYMEPVIGSGERVTVAVVAVSDDVKPMVFPILDDDRALCLLGDGALSFQSIVNMCVMDLRYFLKKNNAFENWQAPVQGVSLGDSKIIYAPDILSALRATVYKSSFMSHRSLFQEESDEESGSNSWTLQIESVLKVQRPDLIKKIHGYFYVAEGARKTPIDFLGDRYAANFSRIVPSKSFNSYIRSAKVKLWNLDVLKSVSSKPFFDLDIDCQRVSYELLLCLPQESDPAYSHRAIQSMNEAFKEIEYEGDKKGLRVLSFRDDGQATEKAVKRIIQLESA